MKPISGLQGDGRYLYRAVDSAGDTIDFVLSPKRYRGLPKAFCSLLSPVTVALV